MKIELSNQQEQAVQQGRSVEIVDPTSQRSFFLLARQQYEQVRHLLEPEIKPAPPEIADGIAPGILRSQQAFWRDLPELLKNKRYRGKCVCYHGAERVGIGDYRELIRECVRRGIRDDEFHLDVIEKHELAPWEVEEVEDLGPHHFED